MTTESTPMPERFETTTAPVAAKPQPPMPEIPDDHNCDTQDVNNAPYSDLVPDAEED